MSDNTTAKQSVWITGIGLLSSLGEGNDAHFKAVSAGKPRNLETERFKPYSIHTLVEPDWSQQISRRDMRQMEPWQQIGTYTAGLALDDANAKDEELCGRMDMIVAAGGGERDEEVDAAILKDGRSANDREALVTERLSNDLRPTLFLAQLSNLLAGNISIVHKVTGSSRTFMGEEGAGISAVQTAHARIASGQSDIVLVGGAFNGEREDMLLLFELGNALHHGDFQPVWSRQGEGSGFTVGSAGAFLVLECADHARKRKATPYAELKSVAADHGPRSPGAAAKRLGSAIASLGSTGKQAVLSGASGCAEVTKEEAELLASNLPDAPVRGYGTVTGHTIESQFPLGIALAALATSKGEFFAPFEASESNSDGTPDSIIVTTVGHWRGEGAALIKPVKDEA